MTYKPAIGGGFFLITSNEDYSLELKQYLRKYPEKSERDFIEYAEAELQRSKDYADNVYNKRIARLEPEVINKMLKSYPEAIGDTDRINKWKETYKKAAEASKMLDYKQIEYGNEILNMWKARLPLTATISEDVVIPEKTIEKMRMLILLGVIDLIRDNAPNRGANANQLGKVLSKILDEKQGSITPIIQAYINKDLLSKNHPFNSEDKKKQTIEKILNANLKPISS